MSWDALHVAATDRSSGSSQIAARAADALSGISTTLPSDALLAAARKLVRGQPIMAACLRLVDAVLRGLDADGPPGAHREARAFGARLANEQTALAKELARRIPARGTVLTVSASSTVFAALASRPDIRVICAVSEPGGEGRALAEGLRASGLDAAVILDGAVAQQSTRADLIVFGAEGIGPESLLNKTGTLGAALGARSNGRPTVCVAGTSKLVDAHAWRHLQAAAEGLQIEGVPVFEDVPSSLVTTFVTEAGPTSSRALRRQTKSAQMHPHVLEWLTE